MSIFQSEGNRVRRLVLGVCGGLILALGVQPTTTEAQTTTRVSVATGGGQGNDETGDSSMSADGRFVMFASKASNLVVGDTNGDSDVFVHDRQTGITTRVSVATGGGQGNGQSGGNGVSSSADGRFVVFHSEASNLVPGDTNGVEDVFVHDRQTGVTTRVSVATGGGQGNADFSNVSSNGPVISANGQIVVFESSATNLVSGDTNFSGDIFVHDRQTGVTTRVSVTTTGIQANSHSENSALSANGRIVAFDSVATNLVSGDTNGKNDVFVHDRQTGTTTRVNVSTGGQQGNQGGVGEGRLGDPSLSADGRFVAFDSEATNLVPGDTNGVEDVFVKDRQTGITTRVSVGTGGGQGNQASGGVTLSADGRFVVFGSEATNLVPGDTNGVEDTFIHDRQTGITTRVSVGTGGGQGNQASGGGTISVDGRFVVFGSEATNLVPGDTNGVEDVFVHDRGPAIPPQPSCSASIGMADLVWRNTSTGDVASWVMTGLALTNSGILWCGVSLDWQIAGVGDLDGDGTRDLVWRNTSTGDVAAWLMTASGVASMGVVASGVPLDWQIAGVNDLDGNGKADVVWRNTSTGDVAGWLMNGLSLETPGVIVSAVPTEWVIAGLGDLNSNGTADVIWRNTTTGDVAGWLMNGLSLETPGVIVSAVPAEWAIVGIRDLDDNGTADLVWRNMTTGDVAGWLMDGVNAPTTTGVIASSVPLEWELQP